MICISDRRTGSRPSGGGVCVRLGFLRRPKRLEGDALVPQIEGAGQSLSAASPDGPDFDIDKIVVTILGAVVALGSRSNRDAVFSAEQPF